MLDDPIGFLKRAAVGFVVVIIILVLVGAGSLAQSLVGWVVDGFNNILDFVGGLG